MKKLLLFAILIISCSVSKEKQIDEIFTDYNSSKLPGAAVLVIHNGEIEFSKGYGLANLERNIPVSDSTNFRLASVTKQFTAMCILQLIEKNKLSLNTTLSDIFEEFPEYGKTITIKNILQHTSGLVDYESLIPDSATTQVKDSDVLHMMMDIDSVYFASGEKHKYSNTGYALLTQIIEKITGKTFRKYLEENIFSPLNMETTLAFENGINSVKNRAYGYTISKDSIKRTDQSITSAVLGDGGIYSNLNDLYKWDQALYSDKLITDEKLSESFKRGKLDNGEEFDYGYGWRLENYKGNEIVYHTGSTMGFRNILYRVPDKKLSLIILTNRNSGGEFSTLELAHKMIDLYL